MKEKVGRKRKRPSEEKRSSLATCNGHPTRTPLAEVLVKLELDVQNCAERLRAIVPQLQHAKMRHFSLLQYNQELKRRVASLKIVIPWPQVGPPLAQEGLMPHEQLPCETLDCSETVWEDFPQAAGALLGPESSRPAEGPLEVGNRFQWEDVKAHCGVSDNLRELPWDGEQKNHVHDCFAAAASASDNERYIEGEPILELPGISRVRYAARYVPPLEEFPGGDCKPEESSPCAEYAPPLPAFYSPQNEGTCVEPCSTPSPALSMFHPSNSSEITAPSALDNVILEGEGWLGPSCGVVASTACQPTAYLLTQYLDGVLAPDVDILDVKGEPCESLELRDIVMTTTLDDFFVGDTNMGMLNLTDDMSESDGPGPRDQSLCSMHDRGTAPACPLRHGFELGLSAPATTRESETSTRESDRSLGTFEPKRDEPGIPTGPTGGEIALDFDRLLSTAPIPSTLPVPAQNQDPTSIISSCCHGGGLADREDLDLSWLFSLEDLPDELPDEVDNTRVGNMPQHNDNALLCRDGLSESVGPWGPGSTPRAPGLPWWAEFNDNHTEGSSTVAPWWSLGDQSSSSCGAPDNCPLDWPEALLKLEECVAVSSEGHLASDKTHQDSTWMMSGAHEYLGSLL